MRPELKQYEIIESYIAGSLSPEEKMAFEEQLAASPELQEQLEFQMMVSQSVSRAALRGEIAEVAAGSGAAGGAGGIGGFFAGKWWAWGIVIVGITTLVYFTFNSSDNEPIENDNKIAQVNPQNEQPENNANNTNDVDTATNSHTKIPETIKPVRFRGYDPFAPPPIDSLELFGGPTDSLDSAFINTNNNASPWVDFDVQSASFGAGEGSRIVGKQGTLIIIPTYAFIDEFGRIIKGNVSVELIEALHWEDMFAYNLTTMSNGKHLKSGGMINIKAFSGGKEVRINPNRPLYIEIPTDNYDPSMMVWEGEEKDGTVNWKNPEKMNRYLTQVNLANLDFLPKGFWDYLESQLPYGKQKTMNPRFTDSVYYSLSKWYSPSLNDLFQGNADPDRTRRSERAKSPYFFGFGPRAKTRRNPLKNFEATCLIDPASIKTIKNDNFQRTYIATKEFEQRLQAMHKMIYGQTYLDIYLANLDKDMRIADSLCAVAAIRAENSDKDVFDAFYEQNATTIEKSIYATELSAFYQDERSKATANYNCKKVTKASIQAEMKQLQNDQEEKIDPSPLNAATSPTYSFTWAGSSWINIDSYLHLLEKGSKTVTINTGVSNFAGVLYQSIGYLNTAITLSYSKNMAVALFPSKETAESASMTHSYCIGIEKLEDGNIRFAYRKYNPYKVESIQLNWDTISKDQFLMRLKAISPYSARINKEYYYKQKHLKRQLDELDERKKVTQKDTKRTRKLRVRHINWNLMKYIDNCLESDAPPEDDYSVLYDEIVN